MKTTILFMLLFTTLLCRPVFCGEIHDAAQRGDLAKVKALLKDNPELVFSKDTNGVTPLHFAAGFGHLDVVALLLANKADVNASNQGTTPLHAAVLNQHKEVADLLVASNAQVTIFDAAGGGYLEKARALLKENPNLVFAKDNNSGSTPLHLAARNDHKDVAELLLANNVNVDAKNLNAQTPLDLAALGGHKDMVELLLANKADISARDGNGDTPLLYATDDKDVVELLLHKKADINAKDNDGETALERAAATGRKEVVELLLAKGADVNAKDIGGKTPLDWAVSRGHKGVADLLRQHGAHE